MALSKDEWKMVNDKLTPAFSRQQLISQNKELQEIRVILIGKTGSGKSYLGNALLGREEFHTSVIATSITDSCAFGKQEVTSRSRKYILKVIDTPGVKDNRKPEDEACVELVKCLCLTLPGPHYFVIVVQIGRFTEEELGVVDLLKREFGDELMNFALVVFTHGSKLKGMSIEDYVKQAPLALLQVVIKCHMRYAVIYDDDKNLQESVQNIIDLIVNSARPEDYYTNDMFKQANKNKKMIVAKIEEDRNGEINALKEEVKDLKSKAAESKEKQKLKEEIERKEEALKIKETISSEEIYDIKTIKDKSVARATFAKKILTAAEVAVLFAGGAAVVAGAVVFSPVIVVSGTIAVGFAGIVATGVNILNLMGSRES